MNKKQVKDMEKEEFKGSSKKGNIAVPRNTGRQIKKTFKQIHPYKSIWQTI